LHYAVFPIIIASLCSTKKSPLISINTALFLLRQIFSTITNKQILETITSTILLPINSIELQKFVDEYPINIPQYSYTWAKPSTYFPTSLTECIFFAL